MFKTAFALHHKVRLSTAETVSSGTALGRCFTEVN